MTEDNVQAALKETIESVVSKCWNCNFCFSVCPNYLSTRGFQTQGPSGITQSLLYAVRHDRFDDEVKKQLRSIVYACTLCNACVNACKDMSSGVSLLDAVHAGRELMVEKSIGPLPRQGQCLESIFQVGNPYKKASKKRLAWCHDLNVRFLPGTDAEVVLYLGCAAAYDEALRGPTTLLIRVLQTLGVNFGILREERCCGDPARFLGDITLFQETAEKNATLFKSSGAHTIVPISPHCYNSFVKYYGKFADRFTIVHYVEFLYDLLVARAPEWHTKRPFTVTYHDPCYLGKHNGIYDVPRRLIDLIPGAQRVEMQHCREDSLCCGGGGGRMFDAFEEERRLSNLRITEAIETGAEVVVTACPWCFSMLSDAVVDLRVEQRIAVMDMAALVWSALQQV